MNFGIVIPVYNGADYVEDAIDSALAQTHEEFDLVVVDDGSTDDTRALVRVYDDPRVRLVANDHNRGIPETVNRGVRAVDGSILAILDHDDVWAPDKLRQHARVHEETDAALVYSDVERIDAAGNATGHVRAVDPASTGEALVRQLLFLGGEAVRTMSAITVRRSDWEAVGGLDVSFGVSADVDLYVRLAVDGQFERIPEPLVGRRKHGNNVSDDYEQIYEDHRRILSKGMDRYDFLDDHDRRRKRRRMAYRCASSALLDGQSSLAVARARESLSFEFRVRPLLVGVLGVADRLTGPLGVGRRVYRAYDAHA